MKAKVSDRGIAVLASFWHSDAAFCSSVRIYGIFDFPTQILNFILTLWPHPVCFMADS